MVLTDRTRAYLALTTSMTLVGSSVPVSKALVNELPVNLITAIRIPIALLAIAGMLVLGKLRLPNISRHDHAIMILQTVSGVVVFNIFLLHGLTRTSAVTGGIITSATPAFVALFALLLGERPTRLAMLGIAITILGVVVLNTGGEGGTTQAAGVLLVVAAVIGEALYTITGKALGGRVSPLIDAFYVTVYGTLMFLPLGLWDLRTFSLAAITFPQWAGLVYLAVFVFVVAFWCWFYGLQQVSATNAGVFTGVIPVAALVCSTLFLAEGVGWFQLIALGCVLAGIVLVTRGERRFAPTPLPVPENDPHATA